MWVLDFCRRIIQDTNPGDFESMFVKAGDSETKEGLSIEGAKSQEQD